MKQKSLATAGFELATKRKRECLDEEAVVFADAGHQGADKRPEATGVKWQVAMRPSKRRGLADSGGAALLEQAEKLKASVRAKVEHPFRVIKRQFGPVKVRYRGLAKNTAQLVTLSNLLMVRKRILKDLQAWVRLAARAKAQKRAAEGPKRTESAANPAAVHYVNNHVSAFISVAVVQPLPRS